MSWLLPPLLTAAGVLALAGISKLRYPAAAIAALAAAGMRAPPPAARALGAAELAIGAACLAKPGRATALLVGLAYLAFTLFAARQLSRARGDTPCGCFGDEGAQLGRWHLGLDLAAVSVAGAAAIAPASWSDVGGGLAPTAVTVVGIAACIYAAYLAFTAVPAAWSAAGAARRGEAR